MESSSQMENHSHTRLLRLVFCAMGICLCYWCYGVLQETLLTKSNLGATFVLVIQTATNVVVAMVWRRFEGRGTGGTGGMNQTKQVPTMEVSHWKEKKQRSISDLRHGLLLCISACYVFAMAASNESLQFVSYPTAVLAKSCKLIPTMVMGTLVERRNYKINQWVAAFLISLGIAIFNLSRRKPNQATTTTATTVKTTDSIQNDHYWKGMVLLFFSLCMDGMLGSLQGIMKRNDETGRKRPPTAVETMLFVNLYALIYLIPMSILGGQFFSGIEYLRTNTSLFRSIFLLNGVVSIGQIFIFLTITWFSSLVCTTITTTRKFFTIFFSVLYFGHKFTTWQWISVCMVFTGLYMSIAANSKDGLENNNKTLSEKTKKKEE